MMQVLERQSVDRDNEQRSFLFVEPNNQTTGSGFTVLVTCDLLSPASQRHCTGSKEVWCHFNDLRRLVPRRLRVRGQTGYQYACEYLRGMKREEETHTPCEHTTGPTEPRSSHTSRFMFSNERLCLVYNPHPLCIYTT